MPTCPECARFVFQPAEIGIGSEPEQHAAIRCTRDQYHLDLRQASEEAFRRAILQAAKCAQFYPAEALHPQEDASGQNRQ